MINTVKLDNLFYFKRFNTNAYLLPMILYLPVGICFLLIRVFIGFQALLIANCYPKTSVGRRFVFRILYCLLGIIVVIRNNKQRDLKVKVVVSNFITFLDHIAIQSVLPHTLPNIWDLPVWLSWLLGYSDFGAQFGREVLEKNVKKYCQESDIPVLVFPEGTSTNGEIGLLKFSVWPFSLHQPIQPVCIKIKQVLPINVCIFDSQWWADILWQLFVPFTIFYISILPPVMKKEEETVEDFAVRVQSVMAAHLQLSCTSFSSSDKEELLKQRREKVSTPKSKESGDSLQELVQLVKNVLPQISDDVIRNDLALTRDVDLTITNILEGRLQLQAKVPELQYDHTNTKLSQSSKLALKKTVSDRQMTLSERKEALVEYARKRYIEKHGLCNDK